MSVTNVILWLLGTVVRSLSYHPTSFVRPLLTEFEEWDIFTSTGLVITVVLPAITASMSHSIIIPLATSHRGHCRSLITKFSPGWSTACAVGYSVFGVVYNVTLGTTEGVCVCKCQVLPTLHTHLPNRGWLMPERAEPYMSRYAFLGSLPYLEQANG